MSTYRRPGAKFGEEYAAVNAQQLEDFEAIATNEAIVEMVKAKPRASKRIRLKCIGGHFTGTTISLLVTADGVTVRQDTRQPEGGLSGNPMSGTVGTSLEIQCQECGRQWSRNPVLLLKAALNATTRQERSIQLQA